MTEKIFDRDITIDEVNKKREVFSNRVTNIKKYKNKLKQIIKDSKEARNRAEYGSENIICALLKLFYIKREAWFSGAALN